VTIEEKAAAVGLTMREVFARGMGWITELLCEGAGAARLLAWGRNGAPTVNPMDLIFFGDDTIGRLVVEVLCKVPDPVARHAMAAAVFVGVGREFGGLFIPSLPAAPDGQSLQLIVIDGRGLDDAYVRGVAAHEIAHCWHRPTIAAPAARPSYLRQREDHYRLCHLGLAWGFASALDAPVRRDELVACELAAQWGMTCAGMAAHQQMAAASRRIHAAAASFPRSPKETR
jgi:hypothetical protein